MTYIKSILFRRDRFWLMALVGVVAIVAFATILLFNKANITRVEAFSTGDAGYLNNGAPDRTVAGSQVSIGETDVLILDITLPDPATDTLVTGAGVTEDPLTDFDGTDEGFADDDHLDDQDYVDGLLIVDSVDNNIIAAEVVTSGTADLTAFDGDDAGADDMFYDENHDNSEGDYSGTELIVNSANTTIIDAEIITSGTADLTAFGVVDAVGMIIFADTTDDNTFDALNDANTEDLYEFIHNGTDDFVGDGTEDLENFAGTEMFYDDNTLGDGNTYNDGEAIISDNDADGMPTAGDAVVTAGKAGVIAFDNADGVYLQDANDDGNYDAGEVIWKDVADTGVFTALTDFVLVGGAAPTCATPCIEIDNLVNESGLAYLDDNGDGAYSGTRNTSAETVIWFGNAVNPTDGDTLATTVTFFDPAQLADDDINGIWLEDLNAFAVDQFFIRVGDGAYVDGDDIVDLVLDGTDVSGDGSEVWDMDANDKFSDTDNDGAFDSGDYIARSADANVATGETLVSGIMDVNDFDATTTYSDANDGGTYTDGELIADAAAAGNVTSLNILKSGTVDITYFNSSAAPFFKYVDDLDSVYETGEAIYQDADNSEFVDADLLTDVAVTNTGTALDADIDALRIWEEDGTTAGFQAGEDTIISDDATTAPYFQLNTDVDLHHTVTPVAGPYFTGGDNQRIYITVDIDVAGGGDGDPSDGVTFIARLADPNDSTADDGNCDNDADDEEACALWFTSTDDGPDNGNGAGNTNVNSQTIDALAPSLNSVTTIDGDNDGFVETFALVFSENLDPATTDVADFTVTGCNVGDATRTVTVAADGGLGQEDEITLTVTQETAPDYDTGVVCNLNIVADVEDVNGNPVVLPSVTATDDGAAPTMVDADTGDADANGQVDRIIITYSEDLLDASVDVDGSDYTTAAPVFVVTAASEVGGVVTLTVTESGIVAGDTDITPTITEAGQDVTDNSIGANISEPDPDNETADDEAPPIIVDVDTLDGYTAGTGDTGVDPTITVGAVDGVLDALEVLYSEPITDATVDPANFTVDGGEVVTGFSTGAGGSVDDETLYIILGNTIFATDGLPTLTYTDDNAGVDVDDTAVGDNDAPTEADASDDTAPTAMLSAETNDLDGDGEVDQLIVTFSEATKIRDGVVGDGFPAITLVCSTGCTVEVPVIANANYGATLAVPPYQLTLNIDEGAASVPANNTGIIITPTYDADAGGTHAICDDDVADGDCDTNYPAFNEMIDGETVTGAELLDGADPAIVDTNYLDTEPNGVVDSVEITFSEDISASAYEDGDWTFTGGDLTLTDDTAGIFAVNVLTLTVSGDANETGVSGGVEPTITYTATAGIADSIVDADLNAANDYGPTAITDAAAPFIISATYLDDGDFAGVADDGELDSLDVLMTENTTLNECDDADWVVTEDWANVVFDVDACLNAGSGTATLSLEIAIDDLQTGPFGAEVQQDLDYVNAGTADSMVDADLNVTGAIGPFGMLDDAGPVIIAVATNDSEGPPGDGFIDSLAVTVTEDVVDGGLAPADFTAVDGTYGAYVITGTDDDEAGTITLTLTENPAENTVGDTDSTPTVTDLGTFADADGNVSTGAVVVADDTALPVVCTHADCDTLNFIFFEDGLDEDGNVDGVTITFSEDVEDGLGGSLALSDPAFDVYTDDSGLDPVDEDVTAHVVGTGTVTITFTEESDFATDQTGDTGDDWWIDIPGAGISDTSGNVAVAQTELDLTDTAAPVIGDAFTNDDDGDGQIDQVCVNFSEVLDDASVSNTLDFEVDGVSTVTANLFVIGDCDVADDALVIGEGAYTLTFAESGAADTDATPAVDVVGAVLDAVGNGFGPGAAAAVNDTARPVVVSTNPNDGGTLRPLSGAFTITFSEPMTAATLDTEGVDWDLTVDDPGGIVESFDGSVMSVAHTAFGSGDTPTATIFDTAADANGNLIAAEFEFSFTARTAGGGGGGGGSGSLPGTLAVCTVTDPNGGEGFNGGEPTNITWTSSGSGITDVNLYYSIDGGANYGLISSSQANDGAYTWNVANTATTQARVKVECRDNGGATIASDVSDANFTISVNAELPVAPAPIPVTPSSTVVLTRAAANAALPGNYDVDVLIKLPDDGDPTTYTDTTVYYIGLDAKRHPFPGASIYFTWYSDFSGVVSIDMATISQIPLGGPILPRPGASWVKIQSDPKTYYVEPNSYTLRWIENEATAIAMSGSNWNTNIIDIEPTYFTKFAMGTSINMTTLANDWPQASLVKTNDSADVYYVTETGRRKISDGTAFNANHFQNKYIESFAVSAGGWQGLPLESAITGMEDALFSLQFVQ